MKHQSLLSPRSDSEKWVQTCLHVCMSARQALSDEIFRSDQKLISLDCYVGGVCTGLCARSDRGSAPRSSKDCEADKNSRNILQWLMNSPESGNPTAVPTTTSRVVSILPTRHSISVRTYHDALNVTTGESDVHCASSAEIINS